MKKSLAVCLALLFVAPVALSASGPDPDTAKQCPPIAYVQGMIWKRLEAAELTLNGSVRADKIKLRSGLMLRTAGHNQEYDFTDKPLQIGVKLDPGSSTLQKRAGASGAWSTISGTGRQQSILGTDITYEDLGVDFINWEDIAPVGLDSIKTLKAYVYDATPGANDHSQYAKVRFWVSAQYWAFLRIDGLNAKGETVKRVEVQDVMNVGKFTVFKEMKVSTMDPTRNDIPLSTTFIDIDGGKEGSDLAK